MFLLPENLLTNPVILKCIYSGSGPGKIFAFSVPFYTLIKLCYTKVLEWSSLAPGPEVKSSSEITNPTSFTVCYQYAPQQEKPPQWEAYALQLNSSPCSPQLEKKPAHNKDSAAKSKYIKKFLKRYRHVNVHCSTIYNSQHMEAT